MAVETVKSLLVGNQRYLELLPEDAYDHVQQGQNPAVVMLFCADSRDHIDKFDTNPMNLFFTIENIGNQVETAPGSLYYPLAHLNPKLLLIMGHTGCGAVKAALGDYSGEPDVLKKELDRLKPALAGPGFDDADENVRLAKYAQRNVDYQVDVAMKMFGPVLKEKGIMVVGAMLDFHGVYKGKNGTVYITNAEGVTEIGAMRAMLPGIDGPENRVKRI